jgi:lipopolysaccharide transport protein LptA
VLPLRLVLAALVLGAPAPPPSGAAAARLGARDAPVEMQARGGLSVDLKGQIGRARGDVVIRRADVTVCCDEAVAHYSGDRIERVECRGRVVILRPDGTRARADLAVFEASKDLVTLSGAARLRSAEADLAGETIVYDIARDVLDVKGDKSRFVFGPSALPPLDLGRRCPP